ncbi:MAG: (Fe-S)-binding protein [Gammaproteobacteria bacterium SG8_47]|nr:MAG: (Fe-S)-binding protein [Gammaproteobacteria bacterium SG8_47]
MAEHTPSLKSTAQDQHVEQEFYVKRAKLYPRQVHGLFATWRLAGVLSLLGLYYAVPWLRWDERQAILFDLPARQFHILGLTFWPQDFFYLAILLIVAAISLFFFTALAGRLWCGYACPQTVWTESFLWMERLVEGDRSKQMKLDRMPWNAHKLSRKAAKHALWLAFSAWTGFTFVGYFTPIIDLGSRLLTLSLGPWETFWVIFYSFATYGNAGWMREQVCIYMCPYARFQSAMFDKDTLIISYDQGRGEPRGSRKRSEDPRSKGLGDCVDCTLCVQVCPTGIDIRDGLQYQCIGCAACVDVCNEVMDKMGYAKGLVRYTTQNRVEGGSTHVLRPRVIVYAALLLIFVVGLGYSLAQRVPLELDIIRDRNALYRETREGLIENSYMLKVINMDSKAHTYELSVSGDYPFELDTEGGEIRVGPGEVAAVAARVRIDPYELKGGSADVTFSLAARDANNIAVTETGRFVAPVTR